MEQSLPFCLFPNLAATQNSSLTEIAKRLNALCGQHAVLTEKLRDLQSDALLLQPVAQVGWQDLKKEVVNLRFEVENFNQIF